ncbi:MAG TPA: hypothetical protein VFG14_16485 [Chthoniobacteraceae bacterium]|nr:hypothetical protein [Chthoniobacteraceae bacterium]
MVTPSSLARISAVVPSAIAGSIVALLTTVALQREDRAERRLDEMQSEIEALRVQLEAVDARSTDASQTVNDLGFYLKHSPGRVIGDR